MEKENTKLNTSQTIHKTNAEFSSKGELFLVAMPLGNSLDMSLRAKEVLESVDFVLAEDTKRAHLNLDRCQVKTKEIFSLNEHNELEKMPLILRKLKENHSIALISDAGMPIISDPGYLLVQECHKEGYKVTVIPGPCAPVTALAASGIAPIPFTFLGFLPRSEADIEKSLSPFADLQSTLIFFERKDRVYTTLLTCHALLGNRSVCIARELTKIHEEFITFELEEIKSEEIKTLCDNLLGEITLVLGPAKEKKKTSPEEIDKLIEEERDKATSPRNLAKRVQSRSIGWKTSDIYNRI